jgi:hypothetical protein
LGRAALDGPGLYAAPLALRGSSMSDEELAVTYRNDEEANVDVAEYDG